MARVAEVKVQFKGHAGIDLVQQLLKTTDENGAIRKKVVIGELRIELL